jgi:flagellar biosynthesis protein FlhB
VSEDTDQESKTEKASERRLVDAFEKGNTPFSREAVTLGSLLGIMMALSLSGLGVGKTMAESLFLIFDHVGDILMENQNDFGQRLRLTFTNCFMALLPIWTLIAAGGIIGALGQNVPNASLERLRPKFERIAPSSNVKRMIGREALMEFAKSALKLGAVALVIYRAFKIILLQGTFTLAQNVNHLPVLLLDTSKSILGPVCLLAFVIAIADISFTRTQWNNRLKMSKQEVKDEFKQSEGDPLLKERIKSLGRRRARNRMMAELPKATLVVVNPTHYAVALRYAPDEGGAPMVLAKGMDHLALRIRGFCEEKAIPVIENRELARGLYGACEIGTMIPMEFYRAVAEIIHFIEVRKRLGTKRQA